MGQIMALLSQARGGAAGIKLDFECTSCSKAFSQCINLPTRMRTPTGEHPFACTTCGKAFSQNYTAIQGYLAHEKKPTPLGPP